MGGGLSNSLTIAFGSGILSALFYAAVLLGGFGALILGYLAPLPLMAAGLWQGTAATVLASIIGTALVTLLMQEETGGLAATLGFLVTSAVPAVVVVRQSLLARTSAGGGLEWYPPGRLMLVLAGVGLGGVALAMLMALDEPGGLEGVIREALSRMARLIAPDQSDSLGPDAMWIAPAMPGLVVVSWLLMTVVNGALAQGLLMRFGVSRRPSMRMVDFDLPRWAAPVFALACAGATVLSGAAGFAALTAAVVLAVPYLFAGLAVVHALARRQKASMAFLVGVYLFVFLIGWPIPFLVGLGMIEQWMGFRARLAARKPDQEDE